MIAKAWLLTAIATLALAGVHLSDVDERDEAVRRFLADASRGTSRIVDRYGLGARQCADDHGDRFYSLAAALLTVETLATPWIEDQLRAGAACLAGIAHIKVDFSIGRGRIRPSVARAALAAAPSAEGHAELSELALARKLLQPCEALRVAGAIAEGIARRSGQDEIDRKLVRQVAATYNGQRADTTDVEARLSAEMYLHLVYAAYQHYRFQDASRAKAWLSHHRTE
jgi:hypothetical protein